MTDITPALSKSEWKLIEKHFANGDVKSAIYHACCEFVWEDIDLPTDGPVPVMALINASLPDTDPRKITRDDVARLRSVEEQLDDALSTHAAHMVRVLADKLAALLPPA